MIVNLFNNITMVLFIIDKKKCGHYQFQIFNSFTFFDAEFSPFSLKFLNENLVGRNLCYLHEIFLFFNIFWRFWWLRKLLWLLVIQSFGSLFKQLFRSIWHFELFIFLFFD